MMTLLPVPVSLREAVAIAIARHRSERLDEAEQIYRAVLAVHADHPDALHFLGVLSFQTGKNEEAITLIERAAALAPEHADVHSNLGNVYRHSGRLSEARRCYERALALDPNHVGALNNLGSALRELADADGAVATLERAVALQPDNPDFLQNLGNAYRAQKRFTAAVSCYRRAIVLRPYQHDAYKYLVYTLYVIGEREEAVHLLRQWVAAAPDNATALHLLSAYAQTNVPERASEDYVRETFREFATSFDEVLSGLRYQAPQLIGETVAEVIGKPEGRLSVLDAGCGTGLCAPLLRPYAHRLVGVDLSPEMLARAGARELYDELVEAELTGYIGGFSNAFDVIIAADTLCYIGLLQPVFAAASRALAPGGWLIFTLEKLAGRPSERGFFLNVHGRYNHDAEAVAVALTNARLAVCRQRTVKLRSELEHQVEGLLVAAQRP